MAPRSRLLDLETHDVLFFYGSYHHHGDSASVAAPATNAIVFWPVFLLAAAMLLNLVAPWPHAAAVCAGLYGACFFLLHRAARRPRSPPSSIRRTTSAAISRHNSVRDGTLYDEAETVSS